jgi:hypothetical protein
VGQVVEHFPSKHKALSSISSKERKKGRDEEREGRTTTEREGGKKQPKDRTSNF